MVFGIGGEVTALAERREVGIGAVLGSVIEWAIVSTTRLPVIGCG
jgi:hypothetical protein